MKSKYPILLCAVAIILSLACEFLTSIGNSLEFEPETLPVARIGEAYEVEIHVTENDTPVMKFGMKGGLPPGLKLAQVEGIEDTARISGVPEEAGTFLFTIRASCFGTNHPGDQGEKEYTLVVEE